MERQIRLIERVQSKPVFFFLTTLLIIGLYLSFYPLFTLNAELGNNRDSFFETRYFWTIPAIVPIVLFFDLIFRKLRIRFEIAMLLCFAAVFAILPQVLTYSSPSYAPLLLQLSLILVLAIHLIIFRFSRGLSYSIRLILFILIEVALVFFLESLHFNHFYAWSFWITHPYRYIFTFTMLAADEALSRKNLPHDLRFYSYVFSPANWITPLPIRYDQWKVSDQKEYYQAKSSLYLVISFFILLLCGHIQASRSLIYLMDVKYTWLLNGFITYLFYFCFSYANINIPIAIAWRFGFALPDPYDLPFLSTTPQDRWRRWNFYFYDWYFRSVFFPTFKKTKSLFAAVMLSFFLTIFIHLGPQNAEFVVTQLIDEPFSRKFYKKTLFFMAHGLAVYLGMRFEKWIPDDKTRKGWIAVFGLFLLMSCIHAIFNL